MNKILLSTATAFILSLTACSSHAPEKRVHRILTDRIQTLAVAESCTGGTIAARFTALPGASAYFKCGVVAYSLDTKQEILQISCDTIARYGAVSEQVVRQMAEGVRRASNSHYAVATTGIAGPTGGTPEYPVGSVWIAVSTPLRTTTRLIRRPSNCSKKNCGRQIRLINPINRLNSLLYSIYLHIFATIQLKN